MMKLHVLHRTRASMLLILCNLDHVGYASPQSHAMYRPCQARFSRLCLYLCRHFSSGQPRTPAGLLCPSLFLHLIPVFVQWRLATCFFSVCSSLPLLQVPPRRTPRFHPKNPPPELLTMPPFSPAVVSSRSSPMYKQQRNSLVSPACLQISHTSILP